MVSVGRRKQVQRLGRASRNMNKTVMDMFARREAQGLISPVHDRSHISAVKNFAGILAQEMARSQRFPPSRIKEVRMLAETSGGTHDLYRPAAETKTHGNIGKSIFLGLVKRNPKLFEFTPKEVQLIADAIEIHELPFEKVVQRVAGRPQKEQIVIKAVQIADKVFEASGHRVIERRAFFVGKERLEKDLKYLKDLYGPKASLYAVAMESCMRLRAINYLPDVEKAIQPIAKPLHEVQEVFYLSLLKSLGLNERQLFAEMERIKFPKIDKFGAKIAKTIPAEEARIRSVRISDDAARSAAELVTHFVSAKSPAEAIQTFRPKGAQAREWLNGIRSYRSATTQYTNTIREKLRIALM